MSVTSRSTRRLIFIALWLGMMIGAMGSTLAASLGSSLFKDVKQGSPYDAAIGEMVQLGIMEGASKTQFKPNVPVKRGELALILKRFRDSLNGATLSTATSSTSSVSSAASQTSQASFSSVAASLPYNPAGYIRFTTTVFSINESLGTATVTLVRTGGNQGTVSVDYVLIPGTAVAGTDYVDSSGTLTFAAKETSKKVQIQVKDDGKSTPERTLTIQLKNPKTAGIANPTYATLKIVDRFASVSTEGGSSSTSTATASSSAAPTTPVLSFSTNGYAAGEDGGSIAITVQRTGVTTSAVNVTYATTNGSATANDHTPATGTLIFAANETSKTFTVTIPDDANVDGSRTVNLLLSNPTNGGVIGTAGSALLTVYDNETAAFGSGSLKFSKTKYDVSEGAGKAMITIMRVGGTKGTATVQYAATGGSATDGTDFTSISGTMTFVPGEASRTFEVPLVKDLSSDGGETVVLTLTNAAGATMGDPATSILTIYD